jgi:hypothetical protein
MLNEHDQRELSLIEQGLCSDDRRIAAGKGSFRRTGQPGDRPDRDASPERRHAA